jgi:hypothetical protein
MIAKGLATVFIVASAGSLAFLGCFLIVRGLGMILGAFLIGLHAFAASAITVLLGVICLVAASFVWLGLPSVWSFNRNSWSRGPSVRPHFEAQLHFLADEECSEIGPLYSGFRATFRYHEVVNDVTVVLVGASQLSSGEEATARLTFVDPAQSLPCIRKGLEFDILDRREHRICRGVISQILAS